MEEGRQQNTGYLNASAAAERLQRNVNREHFLCTDFLLAFWQVSLASATAPKCSLLSTLCANIDLLKGAASTASMSLCRATVLLLAWSRVRHL